jgi:hypothetical protein
MARDPAHERRGHRDAGGGGDEIVKSETHHLGEIRHRGLATVVLPIGVRGETHRRVEGEVLAHGTEPLGVERQQVLQAQDRIGKDDPDQAERQQGYRVPLPILLRFRVDPQEPVKKPFEGLDHRVEKGFPFRIQDPVEIEAHRLGDEKENPQKKPELNPAEPIHGMRSFLEFLGFEDRHEEIRDQQYADDADKDVHHGLTSFPGRSRTGDTSRTSR